MARPQRNNVDYFPFLCKEGKTLFYLEETYGNDGFAVFIKLLRELARTDFHYLDMSKNTTKMFLSAKCKVSKDVLESIICDLVELDKFDAKLWSENSIVWCQDFIDGIQDAYAKRSNNCIDKKGLMELLTSKGVLKPVKKTPKPIKEPIIDPLNPQSKEEHTIEEEIIEEDTKEEPPKKEFGNPEINEVINYLKEKLGGISLDGTVKDNRNFANHLIKKIKKDYPDKNHMDSIKIIIDCGLKDKFHGKNITSVAYIYRNLTKIINSIKNDTKKSTSSADIDAIIAREMGNGNN